MDEVQAVERWGVRLKSATKQFLTCERKWRDFYLGEMHGIKICLDVAGEGQYAIDCIKETVSEVQKDGGSGVKGKAHQMVDMMF